MTHDDQLTGVEVQDDVSGGQEASVTAEAEPEMEPTTWAEEYWSYRRCFSDWELFLRCGIIKIAQEMVGLCRFEGEFFCKLGEDAWPDELAESWLRLIGLAGGFWSRTRSERREDFKRWNQQLTKHLNILCENYRHVQREVVQHFADDPVVGDDIEYFKQIRREVEYAIRLVRAFSDDTLVWLDPYAPGGALDPTWWPSLDGGRGVTSSSREEPGTDQVISANGE